MKTRFIIFIIIMAIVYCTILSVMYYFGAPTVVLIVGSLFFGLIIFCWSAQVYYNNLEGGEPNVALWEILRNWF